MSNLELVVDLICQLSLKCDQQHLEKIIVNGGDK